jgi:DNA repair ATPase RecN
MAKLETQVDAFSSQVTQMTNQISKTVIATLTADDGIVKRQERKMDKMETIIIKMAASIQDLLKQGQAHDGELRVASPPVPLVNAKSPPTVQPLKGVLRRTVRGKK